MAKKWNRIAKFGVIGTALTGLGSPTCVPGSIVSCFSMLDFGQQEDIEELQQGQQDQQDQINAQETLDASQQGTIDDLLRRTPAAQGTPTQSGTAATPVLPTSTPNPIATSTEVPPTATSISQAIVEYGLPNVTPPRIVYAEGADGELVRDVNNTVFAALGIIETADLGRYLIPRRINETARILKEGTVYVQVSPREHPEDNMPQIDLELNHNGYQNDNNLDLELRLTGGVRYLGRFTDGERVADIFGRGYEVRAGGIVNQETEITGLIRASVNGGSNAALEQTAQFRLYSE